MAEYKTKTIKPLSLIIILSLYNGDLLEYSAVANN